MVAARDMDAYSGANSPFTDFDRLDNLPLSHAHSLSDPMSHIIQVEAAINRRPALWRHPDADDEASRRWFPRRLFRKYSTWDSNVLWIALAAILGSTLLMLAIGFSLPQPYRTSLGAHLACTAPPGPKTQAFLKNFKTTFAITSALVLLGNAIVVAGVSLYVGIQCSYSKRKVLANPTNANLTSAFVLPCYGLVWYSMVVIALVEIGVMASTSVDLFLRNRGAYCMLLNFPNMWLRHLVPLLMLQKSVSRGAVRRAIAISGLLTAAVLSILFVAQSVPVLFIAYPFGLVMLSSFIKFVLHTRNSFDVYFYFLLVATSVEMIPPILWLRSTNTAVPKAVITVTIVSDVIRAWTLAAIMLTLRVDTMYWLGLDVPSTKTTTTDPAKLYLRLIADQGMVSSFSTRTSVYDVHYLIENFKNCMVDIASLSLDAVVAQGSTAVVLRGRLDHTLREPDPVAIKLYTTLFVTMDEVRRFSKETSFNVQLSHPNIVRFFGLCVVPPSICLVFEYCDLGSLEAVLLAQKRSGESWDMRMKLKACLDACRAVAYLHSFRPPLLHRDIKTANYLLSSKDGLLKLSDFGESNLLGPKNDGTMTIVGTVDFMAPEMILGGNAKAAVYGTAADVYSLAITLWHILVPGEAPWRGRSHFDVYTEIIQGHRPQLPTDLPPGCVELLESGWAALPQDREPIERLVKRVLDLYMPFTNSSTDTMSTRTASKRSSRIASFLSRPSSASGIAHATDI
ncbi:unnamed protein product [Aphanomyces euteiches]|uniref:Protein kinase domain-containing protein n=1 Tax=Aphanomyces euteiches TaxID=100861 RepID=A0A6G0XNM2_9STRA|nr:hypothetical protein Ae201684_003040 [Aphanomyces euteiches]KAH9098497.1 hypothetical protein Ae201684P_017709 [Aphanomyces euteiches]KAH9134907.1 hypothetical protein AeRB84_019412 [Aphanomyces euteiches]